MINEFFPLIGTFNINFSLLYLISQISLKLMFENIAPIIVNKEFYQNILIQISRKYITLPNSMEINYMITTEPLA